MRVLVCGSRNFTDEHMVNVVLDGLLADVAGFNDTVTVVHGAARGADSIAARWAQMSDQPEEAFPADWDEYGKRAGFIRNQQMIETYPDLVIAFFAGERTRGTQHTCDLARRYGIPLWEVFSYEGVVRD